MTEAPYDDRTRPLLLQQAATRGAEEWRHEDAEAVIAMLLAKLDRSTEAERDAEVAKLREALECCCIKLGRYKEQQGESYIGGILVEYEAVLKLARAALEVTP